MDNTPTSLTVKNALFQLQAIEIRGRRLSPRYRHVQWVAEMEAARTLYKEAIAADKASQERAAIILAERKAAEEEAARKNSARLLACGEKLRRILAERKAVREEAARILAEHKALEENTRKLADIEWMKQLTERRYW